MGKRTDHNIYRGMHLYHTTHTTHSHDGPSRVWSGYGSDAVLICECQDQSNAELICTLLKKWVDIHGVFKCVAVAYRDAVQGCDVDSHTMLWQLKGLLQSMDSTCQIVTDAVNKAVIPNWPANTNEEE